MNIGKQERKVYIANLLSAIKGLMEAGQDMRKHIDPSQEDTLTNWDMAYAYADGWKMILDIYTEELTN